MRDHDNEYEIIARLADVPKALAFRVLVLVDVEVQIEVPGFRKLEHPVEEHGHVLAAGGDVVRGEAALVAVRRVGRHLIA